MSFREELAADVAMVRALAAACAERDYLRDVVLKQANLITELQAERDAAVASALAKVSTA